MTATPDLPSLNAQVMTMSIPFLILRRYRFLPIVSNYWKRFASILDSVIDQECSHSCSSSSVRSLLLFVSPLLNEERVSFYLHRLDSPPAANAPSMASASSAAEEVEEPYSEPYSESYSEPYSESALESALAAVLQNGIQEKEKDESVHESDRPIAESNSDMNENDGTVNKNPSHANQTHPTDNTHQENNHNNQLTPRPTHPNQLILRTLQHMAQSPNQAVTNQALLVVTQSIFAMQQRASQQLHANILHTTQAVSSHVSAVAPSPPLTARKRNVRVMR